MPIGNFRFKTMVSPVNGTTQIYTLVNHLTAVSSDSSIDSVAARNYLNNQYISQNIDAVCAEVKLFKTTIMSHVQVDNWVPTASPVPVATILLALLAAVSQALPYLLITGAAVAAAWALKEYVINPLLYPKIYYGYDHSGPYTREEAVTYNAAHNPGKYVSTASTLVFDTKEDMENSDASLPSGWGLPSLQNIITPIITLAIVGGLIYVGVLVAPTLIRGFSKAVSAVKTPVG